VSGRTAGSTYQARRVRNAEDIETELTIAIVAAVDPRSRRTRARQPAKDDRIWC
jgi:hypothetical protein